jgi:hypothetical protein
MCINLTDLYRVVLTETRLEFINHFNKNKRIITQSYELIDIIILIKNLIKKAILIRKNDFFRNDKTL